jgi:hypothetical protein
MGKLAYYRAVGQVQVSERGRGDPLVEHASPGLCICLCPKRGHTALPPLGCGRNYAAHLCSARELDGHSMPPLLGR